MKIWLATFNPGKIREFETLFNKKFFEFKIARDIKSYSPPAETGETFFDNAKIKADSLFEMLNRNEIVIADDSGLCVEGLNNFPGIFSARYAGEKATDLQNNDKVLKMVKLRTPTNRKAKFISQIYIKTPEFEFSAQGELMGTISQSIKGSSGFGYDPIFIPDGYEQTMAELGLAIKNKISHRKKSVQALKDYLVLHKPGWFNS
jgi:XTP/dITP diphosphohydrolase